MGAYRRNIALSFGLMAVSVAVHGALDKATGNKNVCVGGYPGLDGMVKDEHDPLPITQVNRCTTCNDDVPYDQLKKAREVDGGYVLLTAEEIASSQTDASAYKKTSALTPHPSEAVEAATVTGDSLYYLTPEKGQETTYAALRHLVETHPELTFMSLWTPVARAGQFALRVREGCLVWQSRERAENVREVPEVDAEAPAPMLAMAEQVLGLEGVISEYDATSYADTYESKIADIIASKDVMAGQQTIPVAGVTTPSTAVAGMAALEAMLAQAKTNNRKPAKKAAAKPKRKAS